MENTFKFIVIMTPEIRRTVEPKAWMRKYLSAASDEYWLPLVEINGINDSRFNSNPIQAPNHELEETAIAIPKIKVPVNKQRDGENTIKKKDLVLYTGNR